MAVRKLPAANTRTPGASSARSGSIMARLPTERAKTRTAKHFFLMDTSSPVPHGVGRQGVAIAAPLYFRIYSVKAQHGGSRDGGIPRPLALLRFGDRHRAIRRPLFNLADFFDRVAVQSHQKARRPALLLGRSAVDFDEGLPAGL